jgi:uncharacterized protein
VPEGSSAMMRIASPTIGGESREIRSVQPSSTATRASLFVAATFGWSWSVWGIAIASGRSWGDPLTLGLWAVGALGPVVAASLLARRGHHRRPLGEFWRSVLVPRLSLQVGLALVALAAAPYLLAGLPAQGMVSLRGEMHLGFLAAGLAAGIAEEPGWRGYLQDELQRRLRPVVAMLAVGLVWAAWHLPLFAIAGTYQHQLGVGTEGFWLFLATLVPHAVVSGWIYLASGASIFAVVVFHVLQNAAAELLSVPGAEVTELLIVVALAVGVAVVSRQMMLGGAARRSRDR